MTTNPFARALTVLGVLTSHPVAFGVALTYGLLWLIFSRTTFDWQGAATYATWIMTLLIQRAEHRDTQAIQAKLDELLRTQQGARNELTTIDKKDPEEIERIRGEAQAND